MMVGRNTSIDVFPSAHRSELLDDGVMPLMISDPSFVFDDMRNLSVCVEQDHWYNSKMILVDLGQLSVSFIIIISFLLEMQNFR